MTYDNPTPPGEKPDLTEFPKEYCPPRVECAWYSWWNKQGFFEAKGNTEKKFVMILPPPNITGELHLGHALTCSIEDSLTRYHRMKGETTLWCPGTDHAGIATQTRVEKMLKVEKGINARTDITREEFLKYAFAWNEQYGGNINEQLKHIGSSLDWSRYFFTLDQTRNKSVIAAFIHLFNKGKIYRANRLVYWDCALQTGISDVEVEYITLTTRTNLPVPNHKREKYPFGVFTYFRYQIADENGQPTNETVLIATTRLETMLGDEAVAINSTDERYKHLIGKRVYHPFRKITIPIITDDILVDKDFGTGVVKVTPAHDPNDFEVGLRHNLPFTNILTKDGKINDIVPEFAGLPRFDARIVIGQRLKELGLFDREEPHEMRLGITQRSHDIVEQVIQPQWYVDTREMASRALKAVEDGTLKIVPSEFIVDWNNWHQNIRPWCISRQLWWGHRIPAYQVFVDGVLQKDDKEWVVGETAEAALESASQKLGIDKSRITLEQDPDVLDTWFSSGLLPFSAMHWPDNTADLQNFFPGQLLETGWDILTFWVSRMVMMSLELTDKVPFSTVLLHPLVRDAQGRKMSKSLGNVVNPLHVIDGISLQELIDNLQSAHLDPKEVGIASEGMKASFPNGIPQLGADAMRLALCSFAGASRTANLNINVIVSYRNFCNKMWNAVKFAMPTIENFDPRESAELLKPENFNSADRWVLSKMNQCLIACQKGFEEYAMGDMVQAMIHFFHEQFCSVYLEAVKNFVKEDADERRKKITSAVLYEVIETSLRMLHPCMPFVTEDLWQRIPRRFDVPSIMIAPYPEPRPEWNDLEAQAMENVNAIVSALRHIKTTYGLKQNTMECHIVTNLPNMEDAGLFVTPLARVGEVKLAPAGAPVEPGFATELVSNEIEVRMNLTGMIDFAKELQRLEQNKAKLTNLYNNLKQKTEAPNYKEKVDPEAQRVINEKMENYAEQIAAVDKSIATLKFAIETHE